MPTYQYRCRDCDEVTEVVQKFSDPSLTDCPVCDDGSLRKVFSPVGIVFKGGGFYSTDSRSGRSSVTTPAKDKPSDSSAEKKSATAAPATTGASASAPATDA